MFLFPHSFATRNPAFFIDTRNSIIEPKDAVAQQKSQVAANIGNEAAESISVVLFPDSDSASSIEQLDFHIVVQVPIPPRPPSPTLLICDVMTCRILISLATRQATTES